METSTDTMLAFPCLFNQIFLEVGVLELPDINQFCRLRTMVDLGLIKDITNSILKMLKLDISLISEACEARGDNTTWFTDMGDTPTNTGQSRP